MKIADKSKVDVQVENTAQAFLELLSFRGIDYFFANAGTDFATIVDAFALRQKKGKKNPKPMAIPHENPLMCMAYGYYLATGKPQVAMVHVGVGTANCVGAIMGASRGRIPLILFAGRTPITEEGSPASRSGYIHWGQESFDQAGIIREYVKWDYELRNPSQLEQVLDRAVAMAMTEPQGPVYVTLPREVLASSLTEVEFNKSPRLDIPKYHPDPDKIREIAELLAGAKAPLIITTSSGRTPEAVEALVNLAETGAIGVVSFNQYVMNFPTNHHCHQGFFPDKIIPDADVILVVDCDVPWYPNILKPAESTFVVQIGVDPLYTSYPIRSFPSDLTIQGTSSTVLSELAQALEKHPNRKPATIKDRTEKLKKNHDELFKGWHRIAIDTANERPLNPEWVSYNINAFLDDDTILVNEFDMRVTQLSRQNPGTYFSNSSAGYLGWGLGAALGIKLASPDKTVVATVGDGCFLFSVPSVCHYISSAYNLPLLIIIFNNQGWGAVKRATRGIHPDGWAAKTNNFPLASFEAPGNYEKICEAFGGYGEKVENPEDVAPAIERALNVVRNEKRQAVINMICKKV